MNQPTLNIDELERLALAADQYGDHIYDHQRDSNNWQANRAWNAAASPAAILALIKLVRENVTQAIVDSVYHPDAQGGLEDLPDFEAWLATEPFSPCADPFVAAELAWRASRGMQS